MICKILKYSSNLVLKAIGIALIVSAAAISFEYYMYEIVGGSVVHLSNQFGQGTGFQVKAPSGKLYTMTNAHVCGTGKALIATTQDGKSHIVKVIQIYPDHDLCLMTPIKGLRALHVASKISKKERVWLLGHPGGSPLILESGHFAGDVSYSVSIDCPKNPETLSLSKCFEEIYMQHINNISYPGNSGSPVVNKYGNVVGVLFAGVPSQPSKSFTVPLRFIQDFLKDK